MLFVQDDDTFLTVQQRLSFLHDLTDDRLH